MAYQKLQVSAAQAVTPGTAIERIPNIGQGESNGCILYIGTGGDLQVVTAAGNTVIFVGVAGGTFLPVQVLQVISTSTTATDILACW
tara:strand:+ start:2629 stop:2889 length:261 start_codon:yes stop_codon:yes gene_type:complete